VEVLAVAVPFEALVERLAGRALGERLADPETAACRVRLAVGLGGAADPAGAAVVAAMPAEDVMNAIDDASSERRAARVARGTAARRTRT
jgi:hypothetical protein